MASQPIVRGDGDAAHDLRRPSTTVRVTPTARWGRALSAVTAGVCCVSGFASDPPPARDPGAAVRTAHQRHGDAAARPYDEPDAAAEYYWRKRQGSRPGHDPIVAYREALDHMDLMPRFSTRLGAPLAARPAGSLTDLVGFAGKRSLGVWEDLGPGNIGGRTRVLVIHPDTPEIMYTAGVSGGVWKTVDGGLSWTPLADRIANIAVNSMAMSPDDPDTLYIGTGEGYFREEVRGTWLPLRGAGVYRTSDGGQTWDLLESTDNEDFFWVNDLIVSRKDPDRIYAATRTGVHISDDGGATWAHSLATSVKGGCLDLALRDDLPADWLFASCGTLAQATVYRRKIATGFGWEPVLSEPGMGRTTLAIAPSDQTVIYALSASNVPGPGGHFQQGLHAVYRSAAGGNPGSWQVRVDNTDPSKVNTLLLTNPLAASYTDCNFAAYDSWVSMGWYCNVIAVDPVNPDVVWAAGVDLFRSDNGGRDWGIASYWWTYPEDPSFVHADQHAIVFHPGYDGASNTTMFTANDGGVYFTETPYATVGTGFGAICDPATSRVRFRNLNHNMGITQFYHGTPFPGGEQSVAGTQDNGTLLGTDNLGHEGWRNVWGGDGGYTAIDPTSPNLVYAESQGFGFAKSTDGGRSFTDAVDGVYDSGFLFITPFTMDLNEPRRLWTGGRRLWRTDNAAGSWDPASRNPLGPGQVSAIAVAPGNSQRVLAGTSEGDVYTTESAIWTGPNTTWGASRPRAGFVSSLVFEPGSQDVVYATYAGFGGRHVWRSSDYGDTWDALDGDGHASLPDIPVHSLVVDPDDVRRIYLGTDLGVFTSIDGGLTWAVENTGFANVVTEWLAIGDGPGDRPRLFAFTHGRGAWRVDLLPLGAAPRRGDRRVAP